MRYTIIGNSAAAIGCVEGIRQVDQEGPITIISREKYHTYSRPLISYLLAGKTDEERMKYRADDFYEKNNCDVMLGRTAVAIDSLAKTVLLDTGESVPFDRLLCATGSKPFVPAMEGLESVPVKHTFLSLDDAKALDKDLTEESRVMILGAGLIGLKCAEGIANKVKSVTVVDLAEQILPSILDTAAAAMVQKHIESQGIRFILGTSAKCFTPSRAELKNGSAVDFDVLVLAVGVRPEVELLKNAGADVERGVQVDSHCMTSLPDIYAAGDCTQSYDITSGTERVLALLPNAYRQGEVCGLNMAGLETIYDRAIPMNAIGFFGLHMLTAGSYSGEEYVIQTDSSYKKLVTSQGVLKGYILVGDVARAGIYTALIRDETPLETIDYELIKEKPQLIAFSKGNRDRVLGGA